MWAVLKGPGWEPGKPRLGLHEDLPEVGVPDSLLCVEFEGFLYCVPRREAGDV